MKPNGPIRLATAAVAVMLVFAGCRRDEPIVPAGTTATLRVRIVPDWNGEPFQRYTEFRDWQNFRVKVDMLRFYLSDLRMVNGDGELSVKDMVLVDMDNGPFGFDLKVPAGKWWGMRAGLGLPLAINHSDPASYPNEHPLSVNSGMSWSWLTGYKFVLLDGRFNTDPASTGDLPGLLAIHTGQDTCYAEVGLFPPASFVTSIDSTTNFTIHVGVDQFLHSPVESIDLGTENQANGSNVPLAMKMTRNIVRSMSAGTP